MKALSSYIWVGCDYRSQTNFLQIIPAAHSQLFEGSPISAIFTLNYTLSVHVPTEDMASKSKGYAT